MPPSAPARLTALASLASLAALSSSALAVGESVDGFPNYRERVQHELANRARVDPQIEMMQCGNNCGEAACYTPKPPLYYKRELNHAARFHAAHMSQNGYFAHTSSCTLVQNIDGLYPAQCDGAASCSCVGGVNSCNPTCTGFAQRVQLFGSNAGGEIIASGSNPTQAFYLWLYEPSSSPTCAFSQSNGHRWLLLTSNGAVGFGSDGYYVGDFGGGGDAHKIASGSHWPQQAASVEAWANYYDTAGPTARYVNVDGECTPMSLARGAAENGAYMANVNGVGSGCHRYYFFFKDSAGAIVTFPESGSLGIGPAGSCPDWSTERPPTGVTCDCDPQCGSKECGPDACGGSCGMCDPGATCSPAGQCVADTGAGGGGGAGPGAGGGSSSGGGGPGAGGGSNSGGGDPSAGGSDGGDETSGDDGGCGCATPGSAEGPRGLWLVGLSLAAMAARRRRRRA